MAGRYLVTGVQLGMIKALAKHDQDGIEKSILDGIEKSILEIQDKQYVGNSRNDISEDVLVMREGKLPLFTSR